MPAQANDLAVGQPAPALVLHTLGGKNISIADLRGKVVVVTFWATWCDPCRKELPVLSAYAAKHAKQGLVVLGFALDSPDQLATARKIATSLSFPVGLLGSPWAGGYGRIWRVPVSFVIDRSGILRYDGWEAKQPAWNKAMLDNVVGPLLEKPAQAG